MKVQEVQRAYINLVRDMEKLREENATLLQRVVSLEAQHAQEAGYIEHLSAQLLTESGRRGEADARIEAALAALRGEVTP